MEDKLKHRTLFYRRAIWDDDEADNGKHDLEKYLKAAHQAFTTTEERTFSYSDGEIQGLRVEPKEGVGLFLHVASYTPNQPTSLVSVPSSVKAKDTNPVPPPERHNYMEGDIFFLVNSNNVVLCPSGAREAVALAYIYNIILRNRKKLATKYMIEPIADINQIRLIQQDGVKKIGLRSSLYEASMQYVDRQTTKESILHGLAEEIVSLCAKDNDQDLHSVHRRENISVQLEISFDSRKKGGNIGRKRIQKLAQSMITDHENDGFYILTRSDKRLTPDEIRLCEKAQISPRGNSVSRVDAWKKLENYLKDLRDTGILEQ